MAFSPKANGLGNSATSHKNSPFKADKILRFSRVLGHFDGEKLCENVGEKTSQKFADVFDIDQSNFTEANETEQNNRKVKKIIKSNSR